MYGYNVCSTWSSCSDPRSIITNDGRRGPSDRAVRDAPRHEEPEAEGMVEALVDLGGGREREGETGGLTIPFLDRVEEAGGGRGRRAVAKSMPELAALGGGREREGETGGLTTGRGRRSVLEGIPELAALGGGREAGLSGELVDLLGGGRRGGGGSGTGTSGDENQA